MGLLYAPHYHANLRLLSVIPRTDPVNEMIASPTIQSQRHMSERTANMFFNMMLLFIRIRKYSDQKFCQKILNRKSCLSKSVLGCVSEAGFSSAV